MIFVLWCGLVAGFLMSCAWLSPTIEDAQKEARKWEDARDALAIHLKQPRLSNGRFVSRKQIVTEALRKEQGR